MGLPLEHREPNAISREDTCRRRIVGNLESLGSEIRQLRGVNRRLLPELACYDLGFSHEALNIRSANELLFLIAAPFFQLR